MILTNEELESTKLKMILEYLLLSIAIIGTYLE